MAVNIAELKSILHQWVLPKLQLAEKRIIRKPGINLSISEPE
jgi:hypothetical protein